MIENADKNDGKGLEDPYVERDVVFLIKKYL